MHCRIESPTKHTCAVIIKFTFEFAVLLSVFFALARYSLVKIARSSSEVALQTTMHMVIYPDSGPSLEVIALRAAV
jgi:hypothetical protein